MNNPVFGHGAVEPDIMRTGRNDRDLLAIKRNAPRHDLTCATHNTERSIIISGTVTQPVTNPIERE